jgi:hypothetical protein
MRTPGWIVSASIRETLDRPPFGVIDLADFGSEDLAGL